MIELVSTLLLPVALAASVGAPGSSADTLARSVRTLPAVEVAAEREHRDLARRMPTAAVTELHAGEANRAVESVGELLQSSAGARVISYGGMGAFSTVSLRGAAPGQVSMLLDGAPLTSARNGVVNLADLPITSLARVEVYRSGAPLEFGPATPGGAVNLVSPDAPRVRSARVAWGSYGTGTASGTLAGTRGNASLLASAGWEGTRGDYRFVNDNETPFNTADDVVATRLNDRFDAAHALLRAAWRAPGIAHASLRAEGFHKAQGVPGLGAAQALHPRLTLDRGLLALESGVAPRAAWPGATLRAHALRERDHFRDPEGELHLGRQDAVTHDDDDVLALAAESPSGWRVLTATTGIEARAERATAAPPTLGQRTPQESRRDTRAAHVTLRLHAPGDAIVVQAGRRWDRQSDRVRATLVGGVPFASDARRVLDSPQLGVRVRLPRALVLRANASRTARAPDFAELFGDQGTVAASPRLRPEHGDNWDAGVAWEGRRDAWGAHAQAEHFVTHMHDLIGWQPAPARTVRATNYARATIDGDELAGALVWRAIELSGSAAWTRARQGDPASIYFGKRLPLRPERQAYARLDAGTGAWRAAADVIDLGEDFYDPINRQRLAPRTIVGASVSRTWAALTLTLECKNIGDRQVSDAVGYPIPGRAFFVSCELPGRLATAPRP